METSINHQILIGLARVWANDARIPVKIIQGSKEAPHVEGSRGYHTTPSGKTIVYHPSAYKWPTIYHCSKFDIVTLANKLSIPMEKSLDYLMDYSGIDCGVDHDSLQPNETCQVCSDIENTILGAARFAIEKTLDKIKVEWDEKSQRIKPLETWVDSALAIKTIINGHGPFSISTLKEFKESGPYVSYKELVMAHLHWAAKYGAVYGDKSPNQIYDSQLRY